MKEFPVIDAADQQFGTIINNRRVTIRLRYNPSSDRWTFDLSIDDLPVLYGRKIVAGVDLLAAFKFGIGALVAMPTTNELPTRQALPSRLVRLYHVSEDEIKAFEPVMARALIEEAAQPSPIVQTPFVPPLFGSSLPAARLLGDEPEGFAVDFGRNSALIRGPGRASGGVTDLMAFSRPTAGAYFDANRVLRFAAADELRLDHDPMTGASRDVLVEEARTNFAAQSSAFADASWIKQNVASVDQGALLAPDGTMTGNRLTEDTATGQRRLYKAVVLNANRATMSIFFHRASIRRRVVLLPGAGGNARVSRFDLDAMTATGVNTGTGLGSEGIQIINTDWLRLWSSVVLPSASPTCQCWAYFAGDGFGNATYTGDGVSWVGFWGAQLEAGEFTTSYIPTGAAAATRAADAISLPVGDWWNPAEGTLILDGKVGYAAEGIADRTILSLDNGATNQAEQIDIRTAGAASGLWPRVRGGAANSYAPAIPFDKTQPFKLALAAKPGNWATALNGTIADTSSTMNPMPSGLTRLRFGQRGNEPPTRFSGHIRSLTYIPRRLSNAELQARSAL